MRRFLALGFALALLAPAAAEARVVVVAVDRPQAALLDVTTNQVAARVALPGRARAVAMAADGSRAYVAAGRGVTAIDLASRTAVGSVQMRGLATAVAVAPNGARVYATRARALDVIDAATLRPLAAIRLPGAARALAVTPDGTRAVATLRNRAVVVDLTTLRVRRRTRVKGAGAIAFDAGDRAWISAGRRLVPLDPVGGSRGRAIKLGRKRGGGGIAILGRRAFVGAGGRKLRAAVVDLDRRRVIRSPRTGRGPGAPAWSPDGVRIYVGDRGARTISVLSAFSYRRMRVVKVGAQPLALAVQPGLAVITGTEGNDVL